MASPSRVSPSPTRGPSGHVALFTAVPQPMVAGRRHGQTVAHGGRSGIVPQPMLAGRAVSAGVHVVRRDRSAMAPAATTSRRDPDDVAAVTRGDGGATPAPPVIVGRERSLVAAWGVWAIAPQPMIAGRDASQLTNVTRWGVSGGAALAPPDVA
jgi:hypothetical protein